MSGYRGDGYGVYGDHGDDDFYDEMRRERGDDSRRMSRDDDRMRGRDDDWRMRDRDNDWRRPEHDRDDDRRRFMLGGRDDDDRGRWRGDQDARERRPMSSGGNRMQSWVREHNEDPYQAGRQQGGRGRDDHRGQGFLERAGHQMQGWMRDDDDDRRGSRPPMGLSDRSRQGGGLGMNRGEQRFGGNGPHDHYLSWRERQMAELDRDYDDYCRENEHKFSSDFQSWRQNRRSSQGAGMSGASPAAGTSANAGDAASSLGMGGTAAAGTAGTQPATGSSMQAGGESASAQDASGTSDDGKAGRTKR